MRDRAYILICLRRLALLPLALWLVACGSVSINSEPPGADIYVINSAGDKGKPLGKTPYTGKLSELEDLAGDGPIVVQVKKDGYLPQNIFVPDFAGSSLEFSTALPGAGASAYVDINKIVHMTLKAERMILQNQLDEALAVASDIRKVNENAASSYDIEGAVYLLKGDFPRSRAAWQRSLELEPDNADTAGMMRLVDEKMGKKTGS